METWGRDWSHIDTRERLKQQQPPEARRGKKVSSLRGYKFLLTTWFQTSAFQNCERVSFCYFKSSSLQHFVTVAVENEHTWICNLVYQLFREGNGNPLQCSCLENPRDRGAWWAAVYGVTQSWTWLKGLSSSRSSSSYQLLLLCNLEHNTKALQVSVSIYKIRRKREIWLFL